MLTARCIPAYRHHELDPLVLISKTGRSVSAVTGKNAAPSTTFPAHKRPYSLRHFTAAAINTKNVFKEASVLQLAIHAIVRCDHP